MTKPQTRQAELLASLFASVGPIVGEAMTTAAVTSNWTTVRLHTSPFSVQVVLHDHSGHTLATYASHEPGDPAIVEALAALLTAVVKPQVGAALADAGAGLAVILDLARRSAHVVMVGDSGDEEAIILDSLGPPETQH